MLRKIGKVVYFILMPIALLLIGMMLGDIIYFGWFNFIPYPDNFDLRTFLNAAVLEEVLKWIPMFLLVLTGTNPYLAALIGLGFGIEESNIYNFVDGSTRWANPFGHFFFALTAAEFLRRAFVAKSLQNRRKFLILLNCFISCPNLATRCL